MRLFKGAAPGTHWALNDAAATGGFQSARQLRPTVGDLVAHITTFSHPSPWVSFTSSYAIAHAYVGPLATAADPGFVYEIETDRAPRGRPVLLTSPIHLIARLQRHDHNGGPDLILAVAAPSIHGHVLRAVPQQLVQQPIPVNYRPEFQALVFALRDAEYLAQFVPSVCIVARRQIP